MSLLSDYHQYLLAGKIAGNLSAEEAAELDLLLQNDAAVQNAYQQMEDHLPQPLIENQFRLVDAELDWKKLTELYPQKKPRTIALFKNIAIAAICTGLILGSWWWFNSNHPPQSGTISIKKQQGSIELKLANGRIVNLSSQKGTFNEGNATMVNNSASLTYTVEGNEIRGINTVFVPTGENYQVTLSDGSKIWMNSVTRLDFPFRFTGNTREITLEGEAYIEVSKDAKRPFIVHLPGSSVEVLGTEFNIDTYDSSAVKVALVQGAVNMYGGDKSVRLKPGMQAIYTINSGISESPFNSKLVLSWRNGIVYFENADLKSIGKVISRWFGVEISIDNPALKQKKIKCAIERDEPLSTFLKDLKFIARIESSIDKEGVLHLK